MSNQSAKTRKQKRRSMMEFLGIDADRILCGRFTVVPKNGRSPHYSKNTGRVTNQKGAFGIPKWMRELNKGVYETFSLSNHERCLKNRAIKNERIHKQREEKMMKEQL